MTEKEFLAEVQELLQTDEVLSMDTHLPSLADWDSAFYHGYDGIS
ncbi:MULTISPECIES: hypothetical protein [Symbiopectobacterium]|nr:MULTISPECIES: hypothetical protein [Symbiopectobacterium]